VITLEQLNTTLWDLKRLLGALRTMQRQTAEYHRAYKEEEEFCASVGICGNLGCPQYAALDTLFTHWPEFSGDPNFPVPGEVGLPHVVYEKTRNKWRGDYGAARMRLLNFCIITLEEVLGNEIPSRDEV
jgi:hypothetical protein